MPRTVATLGALLVAGTLTLPASAAAPQDTDIPGVTAEIAFLRQYNGVLHLGVLLHNPADKPAARAQALSYADVVIVDAKANKKYFPLKDANGHFLAGPISDWNNGGRWFAKLPSRSDALLWVLFDAVAVGGSVSLQGPFFGSFDKLAVSETPPGQGQEVGGAAGFRASVLSASRGEGQLKVRIKVFNSENAGIGAGIVSYRDVYALDPQGKRSYPLIKDSEGVYIASPLSDKKDGGRWFPNTIERGGQAILALTFQAPPDSVRMVDVIVPGLYPFEGVAITGEGGAADSGLAVAGKSAELTQVIKDLGADDTPKAVKVNLAADLLFDFDKADINPGAEPQLAKVVTLLKAYSTADVVIDGHTDGKGGDAYNQMLSEKRAAAVAQWLAAHAGIDSAKLRTRGWGKTKPVAANTNSDGSDNPEGRAKNRRVEITISKS
jgi:outer membrane protein OmpA-like peptidoglycan-associated protein